MKAEQELSRESVELTWQQRLAAFWCICWPAWLAALLLLGIVTSPIDAETLNGNSHFVSLAANVSFLALQFPLVHRLVLKNFRTFSLAVVRNEPDEYSRTLGWSESWQIFQRLVVPQALFRLLAAIVGTFLLHDSTEDLIRGFDQLARIASVLVVGPHAVFRALASPYPAFRLESLRAAATLRFFGA